MQVWWQQVVEAIEAQEGAQDTALAALQLAAANAALTQALVAAASTPPAGGGSGGGTSASSTYFTSFNSTSPAPVSDVLTATAGSSGTVTLKADNLAISTAPVGPAGSFPVYGKWQWDSTGAGVWVDVGTEDINADTVLVTEVSGYYSVESGILLSTETKTGLTPASSHKFRFVARNSAGTRTMYLTGTISAVGS